jgi:RNA polymerase sigma-70 factor (ECF subfamily)
VARALRELPPPYRETLELRLREELTYEELAHVLGVPIGTIRSRLHEALRRVRAAVAARAQS